MKKECDYGMRVCSYLNWMRLKYFSAEEQEEKKKKNKTEQKYTRQHIQCNNERQKDFH